ARFKANPAFSGKANNRYDTYDKGRAGGN
ncbi:hypothetical protein CCACVL1_02237, partial [Corchorus capsularis]